MKIWIEKDEASGFCLIHLNQPIRAIRTAAGHRAWVDKDGSQAMWSTRSLVLDDLVIKPGCVAEFELKKIMKPTQ